MATKSERGGKTVVSAQVADAIASAIVARAAALGWSKSRYAGAILESWYRDGCQPISPQDAAMAAVSQSAAVPDRP